MGTRPADRRQTGGGVLAQTSLVLPTCVVPQEDLDRGASCDRTPRVSDRPRSGVGVRAGRRPRRRGVAGRVRARCRLGDDHADHHHPRQPIIDDPARLDAPTAIGVDETAFLRATGQHPTTYATGIADLTPGRPARLCDVVAGRSGVVLAAWLHERDDEWKAQIATASLDPFRGYATALNQQLPHAVRVLDPFHVTKLGLTALDQVRRRVQHDVHGHRGHRGDPLYGIRRILRRRADRLSERAWGRLRAGLVAGDRCGQVTAAWTIAQDLMRCYQLRDASAAAAVITAARDCPVPEIARLGRTLHTWRAEFLAHFAHTDVSNGPTEALNLKIKNTKRTARGFC